MQLTLPLCKGETEGVDEMIYLPFPLLTKEGLVHDFAP